MTDPTHQHDRPRIGLIKVLTLNCDESTRLVSDGLDGELGRIERLALRMHLFTCRPCRRMRAQFLLLKQAASKMRPKLSQRKSNA